MFIKLVMHDLKNGVVRSYKKYCIVACAFLIFCFDLQTRLHDVVGTLGDYLLYPFAGMEEYVPRPGEPFTFPVIWMLIYLFLAMMTLYYPYNDLNGFGRSVLVHSGKRSVWWYSKCIWNMVSVLMFFVTALIVILMFCLFRGISLTLVISSEMEGVLKLSSDTLPTNISLQVLLLPILVLISLCLLQMTLSLFIKPLFSFCVIVTLLLASAYYFTPFMIGNYAMPLRNADAIANGFHVLPGVGFSIILAIVSMMIGQFFFQKHDIVGSDE